MSDAYERRLARAMAELDASGIAARNYAPPLFHLLKALGLRPRPPHYMSVPRAMLLLGPVFGGLWGAGMWAVSWRAQGLPIGIAVAATLLAGVLFGALMAGYYRWSGGQAGLSRWADL